MDNYVMFTGIINCEWEISTENAHGGSVCLIFIAILQSPNDANIQTQLLSKPEQDKDITVKAQTIKCQRLINLMQDMLMLQQSVNRSVTSNVWVEWKSQTSK